MVEEEELDSICDIGTDYRFQTDSNTARADSEIDAFVGWFFP